MNHLQVIQNVGTSAKPAWTVFGSGTLMAWKGEDTDTGIYWSTTPTEAPDANSEWTWAPQQRVADAATSFGPALANLNGTVYMVWRGPGLDNSIYISKFDGNTWSTPQKVPGAGGTSDGPALAVTGGTLYLAWQDQNGGSGIFWSTSKDGVKWTPQAQIPGVGTSAGPALASDGFGAIVMAWKGEADDTWIWWSLCGDGKTWKPQQRACGGALARPALVVDANTVKWLAWQGAGNQAVGIEPGIFFSKLVDQDNNQWSPPVTRLGFFGTVEPTLLATGKDDTGILLAGHGIGSNLVCAPLLLPNQSVYFIIKQLFVHMMRTGHAGLKDGNDTIYANIGYKIKGKPPVIHTAALGNMTGGAYPTGTIGPSTTQITLQETDTIYFGYFALNSGQGLSGAGQNLGDAITGVLSAAERADEAAITSLTGIPLAELSPQEAGALIGAQIGCAIPGVGVILGAIAGWLADSVWNFVFPSCDGPVAAAIYVYGAPFIRNLLSQNPVYSRTDNHPGINSQSGCGQNSNYDVTWSLQNW